MSAVASAPAPDTPPLAGAVLIADDDRDFRALLARCAARLGLTVVEAADGPAAEAALTAQAFDLVVLDMYMPGRSGVVVAQTARGLDPTLQVIVITGSATVENAVDALRAGAYDFLTKPLESLAAFERSLMRALEHTRLLRENARLFEEIQRLAITDPLTGLYNRRKLDEALAAEIERSRRYGRRLSVLVVDLDGMKRINDTRGHALGDRVLQAAALGMLGAVRKVDLATRLGGDEFVVILPEADADEAGRVAARILQHLAMMDVDGEPVSASIGVAEWTEAHPQAEAFLQAADRALYQAKASGGRTVVVAEGGPRGHNDPARRG